MPNGSGLERSADRHAAACGRLPARCVRGGDAAAAIIGRIPETRVSLEMDPVETETRATIVAFTACARRARK